MSEDERVTRDILLEDRPSLVIQVADAKNLKRTLLLTLQIAEMGIPMILDLNMEDEARERGITIDIGGVGGGTHRSRRGGAVCCGAPLSATLRRCIVRRGKGRRYMLNFMLAARRRPHTPQQRYFYEWGIIHVSLMLQTPSVMDSFRRYVQHYSISGIEDDMLIYPLSPMAWDNMADHMVDNYEAIGLPFKDQDYPNRMHPHKFGDDAFAVELLEPP